MNRGKSTWKHNKLLTARRKYFAIGGSMDVGIQTDATTQVGQPGSDPNITIKPIETSKENGNGGGF